MTTTTTINANATVNSINSTSINSKSVVDFINSATINARVINYNDISSTDIVDRVINGIEIDNIVKNTKVKDLVTSIADPKKKTYAMVDPKLSNYFVTAYLTIANLTSKTAWAEREVIERTMSNDSFKKAFGSAYAYAQEIGVSESNLSKMRNSIKVRDRLIELTCFMDYSTSFVDELIGAYNKLGDDFARFTRYSELKPSMTIKEVRAAYKEYLKILAGEARPTKKGFFTVTVKDENGNDVVKEMETQQEYEKRVEALRAQKAQKAKEEAERMAKENEQKAKEMAFLAAERKAKEEAKSTVTSSISATVTSSIPATVTTSSIPAVATGTLVEVTKDDVVVDDKLEKYNELIEKYDKLITNIDVDVKFSKRGMKGKTLKTDAQARRAIIGILIMRGIITE